MNIRYKQIQPFLIVFTAAIFYLYDFFLRVSPSVLTDELMAFYKAGPNLVGPAMSCFFLSYCFMQIPAGLLGDHFGPRKLLIVAALLCGIATILFISSDNILIGGLSRFLIGFAASFAYIAPLMLASIWFHKKYFAFICGLIQFMGCIGAIVGGAPVVFFTRMIGWQDTLFYSAIIGFVLSVLFYLIIRDKPKHHDSLQNETSKILCKLKQVMQHPQTWVISCIGFATWVPMAVFAELWGVAFLEVAYNLDTHSAALFMQYVWFGVAIGGPVLGWFSQKIHSRKKPLIFGIILICISFYFVVYYVVSVDALAVFLFLLGFASASQCVTFGAALDIHPQKVAGTAVGFNNMAVILGGVICQPLVGVLLHHFWQGKFMHSVPVFSLTNYQSSFLIVPVSVFLGLIALLFFYQESFHYEKV